MDIMEFANTELLIVAIICYIVGAALKKTDKVGDKFIPLILAGVGVVLATIFVFGTGTFVTPQDVTNGIFAGLTQGILMAGLSTYVNQITKQLQKTEE